MQTFDLTKAIRTRSGVRGVSRSTSPGIGVFEAADGQVFAYLGTPGGAPWTVMLRVDDGRGEGRRPQRVAVRRHDQAAQFAVLHRPRGAWQRTRRNCRRCCATLAHIYEVFARFCKSQSKWALYEGGQSRRLMFGIVSTPEDLAKNPQLVAREWLQDVRHDELDATLRYAGPPYRLSETPWAIRAPAAAARRAQHRAVLSASWACRSRTSTQLRRTRWCREDAMSIDATPTTGAAAVRDQGRRLLVVRRRADLRREPRDVRRDGRARRVGGAPRRAAQRRAVSAGQEHVQRQRLLQQLQRRQARPDAQPQHRSTARRWPRS